MTKKSDSGGHEGPRGCAEVCVSSMRHGLWACLMATVPGDAVHYRKVSRVQRRTAEEGRLLVLFEDGGKEECDLVIGADGVKSAVRKALFWDDETRDNKYDPVYT